MKRDRHIDDTLKKLRLSRILLPISIGLGVVFYLLWSHFDLEAFQEIQWGYSVAAWLLLGLGFYVIRHIAYAIRLHIISEKQLSLKKAVELIFIWEFATTISPTSLGGSAVAMIFLSLEKIRTSKAVTMVLYTVVLDTLFFVVTIPTLLLILGLNVVRPEVNGLGDINGFVVTFFLVFGAMITYGFIFYYGLFHRPDQIKKFLLFLGSWKFLQRFREQLATTGFNIESSSVRLRNKPASFHLQAIAATFTAWIFKFALMFCILYAFIDGIPRNFHNTLMIYGRYETMFAITAASPTPGGSGLAEYLFGGFYSDFVPISLAAVIAFAWRLIAFYTYLFAGVIVVPTWIRNIYKRKKSLSLKA